MSVDVYVEQINRTYVKLVEWCKSNPSVMLMLCVNKTHWKNGVGAFRDTYPCYSNNKAVQEYYILLKKMPNLIGLHVHIAKPSEINKTSYDSQYEAIKFGRDFLEGLGITVKDFAPGWFSFNLDTLKVCRDLGLTRFHVKHVMELIDGIEMVTVKESLHDYELIGVR